MTLKANFSRVVHHPNFVLIIAGLVGCLAFLMLVSFVALDWYVDDQNSITAFGIWTGGNDEIPTLSLESGVEAGFGKVRGLDRLLLIVPLGAITLLVLAGLVILRKIPVIQGFGYISVVGIVLFIFPFVWQSLSTRNWQHYLDDADFPNVDIIIDQLTEGYSTNEQQFFGFLVVLVSLVGLGLTVAEKQGFFEMNLPETQHHSDDETDSV